MIVSLMMGTVKAITETQRHILSDLVRLFRERGRPIKSNEIAKSIGRDDGTVRNLMSVLCHMKVAKGIAGPRGGYAPTAGTYAVLMGREKAQLKKTPILIRGYKRISAVVSSINIIDLPNPQSMAVVQLVGEVDEVEPGDEIKVGPTSAGRLTLLGTVLNVDPRTNSVILRLRSLTGFPDLPIERIATKKLVMLQADDKIRTAAKILHENDFRAAPVIGKNGDLMGMISMNEIAKAVSERREGDKVVNLAEYPVFTVYRNTPLSEVVQLLVRENVGRVLLVNKMKKPVGIVTRTDIIRWISEREIS